MLVADKRDPSALAAIDVRTGGRWTYGALADEVAWVARLLRRDSKRLVFLFTRNDVASLVAYLAVLEAGHAVALMDQRTPQDQLEVLLATYRPDLVLMPEQGDSAPAAEQYGDARGLQADGGTLRLWERRGAPGLPPHPSLAVLLSTSGSTGSPKLVRLSHRNIVSNAVSIAQALRIGSDERPITSLPLHYSYGLSVVNSHLQAGATLVMTDAAIIMGNFWKAFDAWGCTSFAGVPYSYELLIKTGFEKRKLPTLRHLTQAGGKLAPDRIRRMHAWAHARGIDFNVMYGQTEATARITVLPPEDLPDKLGSVGRPIPGGRVDIVRDGRVITEPGEPGELVYFGPNVMMGYATDRRHLCRGDQLGGRLETGDLGYWDPEGYLFVNGRNKRIAKIFGFRLNLDEVEQMVRASGCPAAVTDVDGKLVAFCEEGDEQRFDGWRLDLSRRLRLHHSAIEFRRVAALPLNANGKVDYQRLAAEVR